MIVVVAAHTTPGVKIPVIEQLLSAGAAAQALLLAAVALGFNGVWKTGAAAYDETVKAALGLEANDVIVGFLYLGSEARARAAGRRANGATWCATGSRCAKASGRAVFAPGRGARNTRELSAAQGAARCLMIRRFAFLKATP